MSMRNILYHYSNIITILLESNKKGHHGMGLHKRPTVGSGAVAAGTYAGGNSWPQKPDDFFPKSLSELKQVGSFDVFANKGIYVDKTGQRYIVRAASFSDNPSEAEDSIRSEMVSDSLYQSILSANPNINAKLPQSSIIMHDGKLCKITKEIIGDAESENAETRALQKQLVGIHGLLGFSGDEQPDIVRLSDGSTYIVNNSLRRSKWTSENLLEEFSQRQKLSESKLQVDSSRKELINLYGQQTNLIQKMPKVPPELMVIANQAIKKVDPNTSVYSTTAYNQTHWDAIDEHLESKKTTYRKLVSMEETKIQYLTNKTEDISILSQFEQKELKLLKEKNPKEIDNYIAIYNQNLLEHKANLDSISSDEFNKNYSDWKTKRTEWGNKISVVEEQLSNSKQEHENIIKNFDALVATISPLSNKRRIADETGAFSKNINLHIGLGDGVDEIFGSMKNMSPDEVFSSIKFAKNNAIAARNSMIESITKNIEDKTLREAMIFKLDKRIDSLSRLDTAYDRMLSDSSASFNKNYLLDFGKHHQGIASDLIAEKYFENKIEHFNLSGTKIKEFDELDQKLFANSNSVGVGRFTENNGYNMPLGFSTATSAINSNISSAINAYMLNSGVGSYSGKKTSKSAQLVEDWTRAQGQNSVVGLAGGARLGFVDQIMKYDENLVAWGRSPNDGEPMTKIQLMHSLFQSNSLFDKSKISVTIEDLDKLQSTISDSKVKQKTFSDTIKNLDQLSSINEEIFSRVTNAKLTPQQESDINAKLHSIKTSKLSNDYDAKYTEMSQQLDSIKKLTSDSPILRTEYFTGSNEINYELQKIGISFTEIKPDMVKRLMEDATDTKKNLLSIGLRDGSIDEKGTILSDIDWQNNFIKSWLQDPPNKRSDRMPSWSNEYENIRDRVFVLQKIIQNKASDKDRELHPDEKELLSKLNSLANNIDDFEPVMKKHLKEQYDAYKLQSELQLHKLNSTELTIEMKSQQDAIADGKAFFADKLEKHKTIIEESNKTLDSYVEELNKGIRTGLNSDFGDGMTVQHALTYTMLNTIAAPQHDQATGTVTLYRTESARRIVDALQNAGIESGTDPAGAFVTIQRGLTDSFSAFAPISIGNRNVTVQEVPFHRVLGTFTEKGPISGENLFYGPTELEYLVMPVGLTSQYLGETSYSGVTDKYTFQKSYEETYKKFMQEWSLKRPDPYGDGVLPQSKAPTFTDLSYMWGKS